MDPNSRPRAAEPHDSLRSFDAYADRNGQDLGQDLGQDEARDVARPVRLQQALEESPDWQAEAARTASGFQRLDATGGGSIASVEATEAETPPENLDRIGNASTRR